MIKKLAVAATLFVVPLAHAGSLSISVTTAASGTVTKSVTVSDADIGRMIAAYKGIYPQTCDSATPPNCRTSTNADVLSAFASGIFGGIQALVQSQERAAASATASAGVAPIGLQ